MSYVAAPGVRETLDTVATGRPGGKSPPASPSVLSTVPVVIDVVKGNDEALKPLLTPRPLTINVVAGDAR